MLQTLDAYIDRLAGLCEEEKGRLFEEAKQIIGSDISIPNPGPQTGAYYSEADLLLYGCPSPLKRSQELIDFWH